MKQISFIALFFLTICVNAFAQNDEMEIADTAKFQIGIEGQASFSGGKTPLWLNANKHGLSSLKQYNGYIRASISRRMITPEGKKPSKLDYGFGVDLVGAYGHSSAFVIQQAYAEGRWLKGVLTIGSKERPIELKNDYLSSGSQTLGKNARPVPQVRLELGEYWSIPGTKRIVSLKGHIAYGMMTDNKWSKSFTDKKSKFAENTLYHSKAGYLRIGNDKFPLRLTLGVEMASLFGGNTYLVDGNGNITKLEHESGIKAFWDAFIPTSGDGEVTETTYKNVAGDMLGSYGGRIDYENDKWEMGLYLDHFFEDHSQFTMMSNYGYGVGDKMNKRKGNHYFSYKFKDMMLGLDFKLKSKSWVDAVTFEYIYTKYQSGPVYHDHTITIPDNICGNDNYYNHHLQNGWQHWGQVIGNPLYLSPIYNEDGVIEVKNNRFVAYHLGFSGHPIRNLGYKVLATYQDGMGTYNKPYDGYKNSFNLLLEASYQFPKYWFVTGSFGLDRGDIHGNNTGFQLSVKKYIYK